MIHDSSLSVAIKGFADTLSTSFSEDVLVTVDTPKVASEQVKGSDKAILNIFPYRLMPSGLHPDLGANDPFFMRALVLLTAFSNQANGAGKEDDLKVLGHAISTLNSSPVIDKTLVLEPAPGLSPDPRSFYRLQAVFQPSEMEEMNHIWSIQGSDLAYRLSAAYELALIPVEPQLHVPPPLPVEAGIVDISPGIDGNSAELGDDPIAVPPPAAELDWLPFSMLITSDGLKSTATVTPTASEIDAVIAGPPGDEVEISVEWTDADATVATQPAQTKVITAAQLSADAAPSKITLSPSGPGAVGVITIRATTGEKLAGNTLTLVVEAAS